MELLKLLKSTFDAADLSTQYELVSAHLDSFLLHISKISSAKAVQIINNNHRLFRETWESLTPNHYFFNKGPQKYLEEMLGALERAEFSERHRYIVVYIPEHQVESCSEIQQWAYYVCEKFFKDLGIRAVAHMKSNDMIL